MNFKENSSMNFNTPILFTIFNRPDTTKRVFDIIKKIQPSKLYIAADGPRTDKAGEDLLCKATREITEDIDWTCDVHRKYSERNLGCKLGMSSAINWFFEDIEQGIILEDDCLPVLSFFSYCEDLLKRYANNTKIKMITGDNFLMGKRFTTDSYYFSRIPSIWGWATWRRAWKEYDLNMSTYSDFVKNKKIKGIFENKKMQNYWLKSFSKLYAGKIDTWDGQWVYAIYNNDGISITPTVNLVSNIGFGEEATHTKTREVLSNLRAEEMTILTHPSSIVINTKADNHLFETIFHKPFFTKIINKIKNI